MRSIATAAKAVGRAKRRDVEVDGSPRLLVASLCMFILAVSTFAQSEDSFQYAVVLDAGSSGTRVHVYKFVPFSSQQTPVIDEVQPKNSTWAKLQSIRPGISAYSSNPPGVVAGVSPLISFALEHVPASVWTSTPLYLGATAGMRLLTAAQQTAVMTEIRKYFSSLPFVFTDNNARIISGEEEGVFGYLQINYVLKLLGTGNTTKQSTFAVMDLGGASTQLTFEPKDEILAGIFRLQVDQIPYQLYTHSYLLFGQNQISSRFFSVLADGSPNNDTIANPCHQTGYSEQQTINSRKITFYGTSNATACKSITKDLLYLSAPCLASPCAAAGVYQPTIPSGMTVFGMSNFYNFVDNVGLLVDGEWSGTPGELDSAATSVCNMQWSQVPKKVEKNPVTCMAGMYIRNLLIEAYQVPVTARVLRFSDVLFGITNGWTLGGLIYEWQQLRLRTQTSLPAPSIGSVAYNGFSQIVSYNSATTRVKFTTPAVTSSTAGGDLVTITGNNLPVGQPIRAFIVSSDGATVLECINASIISSTQLRFRTPPLNGVATTLRRHVLAAFETGTGYDVRVVSNSNTPAFSPIIFENMIQWGTTRPKTSAVATQTSSGRLDDGSIAAIVIGSFFGGVLVLVIIGVIIVRHFYKVTCTRKRRHVDTRPAAGPALSNVVVLKP